MLEMIAAALSAIGEAIVAGAETVGEGIVDGAVSAGAEFSNGVSSAVSNIGNAFSSASESLSSIFGGETAAEEAGEFTAGKKSLFDTEMDNPEGPVYGSRGFLADSWDTASAAGEKVWNGTRNAAEKAYDVGKEKLMEKMEPHIKRNADGSVDSLGTAGDVGHDALKEGVEKATRIRPMSQMEMPNVPEAKTQYQEARTPQADEALKQLMNMMHNS